MNIFQRLFTLFITAAVFCAAPVWADPSSVSGGRARLPDALWRLNAAGQLVLHYDPFRTRTFPLERVHTVVLNDRAPKMCGDPDGTGRHTWFFTDALLIEVEPLAAPRGENDRTHESRSPEP